jgi:hypothetical protein
MDVGRFLAKNRHHSVWQGLMDGQRDLLEAIGVAPLPSERAGAESTSQSRLCGLRAGRRG